MTGDAKYRNDFDCNRSLLAMGDFVKKNEQSPA